MTETNLTSNATDVVASEFARLITLSFLEIEQDIGDDTSSLLRRIRELVGDTEVVLMRTHVRIGPACGYCSVPLPPKLVSYLEDCDERAWRRSKTIVDVGKPAS